VESFKLSIMNTYLVVLRENVVLNKEVLSYFVTMNFTIQNYYPTLNMLKIETDLDLNKLDLKFIKSVEMDEEKGML